MTRRQAALLVVGVVVVVPVGVRVVGDLVTTRGAVTTFSHLIAAANAGDLAAVGDLCSSRYRRAHPPTPARGGGVIGLPRQVHPNFRAWVAGAEVRLCAGNRVGTVYGFVRESGAWRFDGPVGLLGGDGQIMPIRADPQPSREKP